MASSVLDVDLAAALDQISAGLNAVFAAGVDPFDSRDAVVLVRETEVLARRLRTVQTDELTAIDQRGLHRHDGHASAKVMVRHVANLSNRAQRHHENRDAKLVQDFDQSWNLSGGCGSLQGLELHDILQRFIDAEWRTDWAKARATHGDAAAADDLARTDNQRRFDALYEIFQRAAASLPGRRGSLVVTNLIIDLATFERICRRMTGTPVDLDPRLADLLRSTRPTTEAEAGDGDGGPGVGYRCSGIDGQPIDPTEAVANALTGHIRRVIIDTNSTVIDLSRQQRIFTGAAALAAQLANTECYWPGCHVPVTDCQIDHLIGWADHGGRTNPANGAPACGKHNRYKEHGYTAWRDQTGTWHIQRPDGTQID